MSKLSAADTARLTRIEEKLRAQLRRDRAKPSRRVGVEPDGTIIVNPSGIACGLAIAIEHLTGEDSDTILKRVGDSLEPVPAPAPEPAETAIVISVPDTDGIQVLVRLPGHIAKDDVAVDFRPDRHASWTPAECFGELRVAVRHQ
jgi:hypothetical protein